MIVDADTSIEGWIRACQNAGFQPPCDGAHVVNQPIGAQSWFPSNNYPTDKAAFDTFVTVPNASTAFGIGELASRRSRGGQDDLALARGRPDLDLPDDRDSRRRSTTRRRR